MLYPLTFHPILKQHPWGGRNLERLYSKRLPPDASIGESWEVSDRPEGCSVVSNGPLAGRDLRRIMDQHADQIMGKAKPLRGRFPLLVKILDAAQSPSVQVHPQPSTAAKMGGEPKTELWYVTHAHPQAHLFVGLRQGVRRLQFERKIAEGSVDDCLHKIQVRAGDAMFVPSGRVHTIGPGIVLFEIQENSDTTYRVFDWNRLGPDGQPRPLHVEQAMAAIDFDDFEPSLVPAGLDERNGARVRQLAATSLFVIEEQQVPLGFHIHLTESDRPSILGVATGLLRIQHPASGTNLVLSRGQFCLVPAQVDQATLSAEESSTFVLARPGVEEPRAAEEIARAERPVVPAWQVYESRRQSMLTDHKPAPWWSWQKIKKRLARKLVYSPFLRMLLLKFWFRMTVLIFLVAGLALAVLLPPIWRVTPPDFVPVVRMSLLDRLQARMLRRTAERASARKDFRRAAEAWRAAFGNNPASPDLARGMIRNALEQVEPERGELRSAWQAIPWLLRLTHTNYADLELSVQFLDKFHMRDQVYEMLSPMTNALSPTLGVALTKAAFFESQLPEFLRLWGTLSLEQKKDPHVALCYSAYLAGWGPAETAAEGRQHLAEAAVGPQPVRNTANQILLVISAAQTDTAGFEAALQRLEDARAASGYNYSAYWMLLAKVGRKEEAIQLARDYAYPPRISGELASLAKAYAALGLNNEAQALLERYANTLGGTDQVWLIYAAVALEVKDWERLRSVALQMRGIPALRSRLEAVGYYYEGRANQATGSDAIALLNFQKAADLEFPSPAQAYSIAQSLVPLGFPGPARTILEKIEPYMGSKADYWETVFSVAMLLKEEELLVKASHSALKLSPTSPVHANRYAAALLIAGNRPLDAVTLTRKLAQEFPNSVTALVNHSLALLMNRRTDEAASLLGRTLPERFTAEERNSYTIAKFHLAVQQQRFAEARKLYEQIEMARLFPAEQNWIESALSQLPQ